MAILGVSDHAGWAVLVTVERRALVDRRRIVFVDDGLPVLPHHHEAQALPLDEGIQLVERVRASAQRLTAAALAKLSTELSVAITGIALRKRPTLPATIEERITRYSAQTKADSVMYRDVFAQAAQARGWSVAWYDPKRVFDEPGLADLLRTTGKSLGPPWQLDHRLAMAGAIAAG
jgi:hypothetical protein